MKWYFAALLIPIFLPLWTVAINRTILISIIKLRLNSKQANGVGGVVAVVMFATFIAIGWRTLTRPE
jgi:hypothetical protein